MESRDLGAFTQLIHRVSEGYGKSMSKSLVEMYWAALQGFDLVDVKRALQAHVVHPDAGRYMPKPADVIRFLQGDSRTQALRAWSRVVTAIREVGGYESVVFDDPIIHAVIRDMDGWIRLCQVREDELPFRGHDFQARYAGYVGYPLAAYPRQLTGRLAHQQGLADPPVDRLMCIGDKQKALQVYHNGQAHSRGHQRLFDTENTRENSLLPLTVEENLT